MKPFERETGGGNQSTIGETILSSASLQLPQKHALSERSQTKTNNGWLDKTGGVYSSPFFTVYGTMHTAPCGPAHGSVCTRYRAHRAKAGARRVAYLQLEILIRSLARRILRAWPSDHPSLLFNPRRTGRYIYFRWVSGFVRYNGRYSPNSEAGGS